MMIVKYSKQFKKDVLTLKKSGWSMRPFDECMSVLMQRWPLPAQYEAHPLQGDKRGIWDIHIRQDWLVLLKKDGDNIILLRTGTHASLGID